GLARGYLGRPDLTAAVFIPDPFAPENGEPGGRLYRSGDLARLLPDGNIQFLGRLDHQVKIRGVRIELGEIEAVLARHPAVQEAVVLVHEDALVAYVAGKDPGADLTAFLRRTLPASMIPSAFVFLDAMPVTPNGKADRKALAKLWPERAPSGAVGAPWTAPRTPTEERLAEIFAAVLRVERVGIEDNFFERGGHSLRATQVASRVRDVFGVELPVRVVFEAPTVEELADRIEEQTEQFDRINRISRDEP